MSALMLGLVCSSVMAFWALRRRSLSWRGAGTTVVGGTLVFALAGWAWGFTVVVFFVAITWISHYRWQVKNQLAPELADGTRRGFWQAVANGGLAVVFAKASYFYSSNVLLAAFVGTMAATNGDTWASEMGMLSGKLPRMVTNGRRVSPGTSGAVTWLGLGASAVGGLFVGVAAYVFLTIDAYPTKAADLETYLWLVPLALVAGSVGALFDSILGATTQTIYYCDICRKETENTPHRCGTQTRLTRGWRWMSGDMVNFLALVLGAGLGLGSYLILGL